MKKIISIFILIVLLSGMLMTIPVYAANELIVVGLNADKTVVSAGDTIDLTLSVTNNSAVGGMKTFQATIDFANVFELATGDTKNDIVGKNNWTLAQYNEGTFVMQNTAYVKEPGDICTIKLKLKNTASVSSYEIKVKDMSAGAKKTASSTYPDLVDVSDVKTTVSVKSVGAKVNTVKIDGSMVKGIEPGTKVSQMTNYVSGTYTIKNSANAVVGANEVVASGMKLVVSNTEEYTIYVKGDLNGDGKISIADVTAMKYKMVNLPITATIYLDAGDIDLDERSCTVADFARLIDYVAGISTTI